MALLDEETDSVKSNINRLRVVSLRRRRSPGGSGGGGGTPETATEPTFIANAITDTEVRLWWPDEGTGCTYDVQRATDSGFTTGLTNLLTDAAYPTALADAHTYADTGLTAGTLYYYRVRAKKSGQVSAWVSDSARTIFDRTKIVFWIEPAGLQRGQNNAYGNVLDTAGNQVDSLKSIINTSGLTFTKSGTPFGAVYRQNHFTPLHTLYENAAEYACTRTTITGDFCFVAEVYGQPTIVLRDELSSPFTEIQATQTAITIKTSASVTRTFARPVALDYNRLVIHRFVIKRESGNISVSFDDGATFSATQADAGNFIFNTLFGAATNGTIMRAVLTNTTLTQTEIQQALYYLKRPNYSGSQVPSSISVKGLTYSTSLDSNGYLVGAQNEGLQWFDQALWGFGTTHHVMYSRGPSAYQNRVRFYNESQFTNEYILPITESSGGTPGHSIYSFYPWNNNPEYFRPYAHYDQDGNRDIIMQTISKFDYNGVVTYYPHNKGIAFNKSNVASTFLGAFGIEMQYLQQASFGNTRIMIGQSWNGSAATGLAMLYSVDGGNYWERTQLIVTGDNTRWLYPSLVYNGTNNEFTLFFHVVNTTGPRGIFAGAIKCSASDLTTWRNLSETFSKNVSGGQFNALWTVAANNAITLTEVYANTGFEGTALDTAAEVNAQVGHTYITCPFQDSDGVRYSCYLQNGTFKMVKVVGTTITTHTINTGRNFVNAVYGSNSYGVIVRTGTDTYDAYLPENTNSDGRHQIGLSRTTDGGANWNFIGVVTSRATDRHDYLVATRNMHYNSAGIIACRSLANPATTGEGDIWIRKVK